MHTTAAYCRKSDEHQACWTIQTWFKTRSTTGPADMVMKSSTELCHQESVFGSLHIEVFVKDNDVHVIEAQIFSSDFSFVGLQIDDVREEIELGLEASMGLDRDPLPAEVERYLDTESLTRLFDMVRQVNPKTTTEQVRGLADEFNGQLERIVAGVS